MGRGGRRFRVGGSGEGRGLIRGSRLMGGGRALRYTPRAALSADVDRWSSFNLDG